MKPLALALAAVLGAGCIVVDDDPVYVAEGTVNLYWDFSRRAPAQTGGVIIYDDTDVGTPDGACDESGVDSVTVDSPVGQVTVDCVYGGVEGVALDYLPEGTRTFRVRGWRGDVLVYDDTFNLAVQGNAETDHYVDVRGVAAALDMFAYLAYGTGPSDLYPTCGDAGSPDIAFEIRDVFGTLVDDGRVGCGAPADPMPIPVFAGSLDLDDYDVRMRGIRLSDQAIVFDSCTLALEHFAAETGQLGFAPKLFTPPSCI